MATHTIFHPFPRLPLELREEIWSYCLPHRVCELDLPNPEAVFELHACFRGDTHFSYDYSNWTRLPGRAAAYHHPPFCELKHTTRLNGCPPTIARVCHESRTVAFREGGFASFLDEDPQHRVPWSSNQRISRAWRDPTRDSVHLNWTCWYPGFTPEQPMRCLYNAAKYCAEPGSLMVLAADCLHWSRSSDLRFFPPQARNTRLGSVDADLVEGFQRQAVWHVVMRTFIIHCDIEEARSTGLFGLLCDAPVQLVDVQDTKKIKAFIALSRECEKRVAVPFGQNFSLRSVSRMTRQLQKVVSDVCKDEQAAKKLRAVLMFRWCPLMCNFAGVGDLDGKDPIAEGGVFEWRCDPASRPALRRHGWRLTGRIATEAPRDLYN